MNPEITTRLLQIHAARADFDKTIIEAIVRGDEAAPRSALMPIVMRGPNTNPGDPTLNPGQACTLSTEVISYAAYTIRGFRVLSSAPISLHAEIYELQIGGGCNLLYDDNWAPIESYRNITTRLRFEPLVRAPNMATLHVRNTGPIPIRFAAVLDCEFTHDECAKSFA